MEEMPLGIQSITSNELSKIKEEIDKVKKLDEELQKAQSKAEAAREALKPEIERLGRIIQEAGLGSFNTGLYELVQGESEYYSFTEEGKRKCIKFFDKQGLFNECVSIAPQTLNSKVRGFVAQGIEVPGVKVYKKWTAKIKKG